MNIHEGKCFQIFEVEILVTVNRVGSANIYMDF